MSPTIQAWLLPEVKRKNHCSETGNENFLEDHVAINPLFHATPDGARDDVHQRIDGKAVVLGQRCLQRQR